MAEMTTEQRVLTALRCEQPDRVPIFVYLNPYVNNEWYSKDPSYTKVLEACKQYADVIYDWYFPSGFFHTSAAIERETRQLANGDVEYIIHTHRSELLSISRADWRGGGTVKRWVTEPEDVEKLLSIPYVPARPDLKPFLDAKAQNGKQWVTQVTVDDPICAAGYIDEAAIAIWTIEHRDLLRAILDTAMERIINELKYCLDHGVGPIYYFNGPEYALPPLMSPGDFEEFVLEYDTKLMKLIHSYPGNYVIVHSHGRVGRFLENFATMEIDGLNVLEPPPIGDTLLSDAKKRIGKKVCLIGNIQYDDIARGTEDSIEQLAIEAIAQGGSGGGFILSPCASPYEQPLPEKAALNLIHYMRMGHKHGRYS
jgi:uroporphyrinogen-III decarboxylase